MPPLPTADNAAANGAGRRNACTAKPRTRCTRRNWEKAIKYLEKLEARYPYGRFAQQAQLDVAYAYWKSGERASAVAAADRFIKLYPNHANVDYAWYLKGLVTSTRTRESSRCSTTRT